MVIEEIGEHVPLFSGTGVLRYSQSSEYGFRLVMECDQTIADYYRALIPKYKKPARQRYGAHVSVVRKEVPKLEAWGKHEGELVDYFYTGTVYFGGVYCWLNVFCARLEEVRRELGLPVTSKYTLPPEGFIKCFHLTIGNYKEQL